MEIGEQHINRLELIAWRDEERCFARKSGEGSVGARRLFEDPEARCPCRNDPLSGCPRLVKASGRLVCDLAPFGVHFVICGVVSFDLANCASAKMQCYFLN